MSFVIDHFEEVVQKYSFLPAIRCENEEFVTYQYLNQQADFVAEIIVESLSLNDQTYQVEFPDTPLIGLMMERNIGIVTMFLGVHKAGCAYVPIDPAFPPDRQAYILEHSKCDVVIVDEECWENAKKNNMNIQARNILISDDKGRIISRLVNGKETPNDTGGSISVSEMKTIRSRLHHRESIAYVLYTSGSTGKPKGVAVKQVGVENIISFFADELKVCPGDAVMGLTTFCFDISVLETFVPLTRGGTFVLAASSTRKDPFRILEIVEKYNIRIFQATPTTYEMLLATGWTGDPNISFLIGGEAFRPSILPLAKNCKELLNVYGPTETTIWSTYFRVTSDFEEYAKKLGISGVPIGREISQTSLYLVSEKEPWTEVKRGEEGELWIGGIGVAAGYLHAPELTKERFIPNPFGDGLIYRTGDLVKQLPDENYIFIRRIDDQVKIDGFRIELEEIENVFMQHPAIEKAVALVREKKLVIYLKLKDHVGLSTDVDERCEEFLLDKSLEREIYEFVGKSLTYYMIPKFSVVVKDFPKTPNGKLDRKALPTPEALKRLSHDASSLITKSTEKDSQDNSDLSKSDGVRRISAVICDAVFQLRGSRPHPNATLSSFGLDSLGSVMLLRQLTSSTHNLIPLKLQDLFVPSMAIRDLGAQLYEKASDAARSELNLIPEKNADELVDMEGGENQSDFLNEHDYYGAALLANKRLIDGLRGIFTIMVLYNHWHSDATYVSTALNVDTTLFYMISGFTTASQLRAIPEIKKESDGKLSVPPKPAFSLSNFYLLKAVGLYPIMWLTLLLSAPMWYMLDEYQFSTNHVKGLHQSPEAATCTFLYVIGMNVWSETCTRRGPDLRYASGLIITMMLYGGIRYLWTEVLRRMSSWVSDSDWCTKTKAFTLFPSLADQAQPWRQYFGKLSYYLSYNLYHPEIFWKYVTFFFIVTTLIFFQNVGEGLKILSSLEYFAVSAALLVVSEMWNNYRVSALSNKNGSDHQVIQEDFSSPTDTVNKIYSKYLSWLTPSISLSESRVRQYQVVPRESTSPYIENSQRESKSLKSPLPGTSVLPIEERPVSEVDSNGSRPTQSALSIIMNAIWRFAPDLIAVGIAMSLSCQGDLCKGNRTLQPISSYIESMLVPAAFLFFLFISIHQRGSSRFNFSRLLLESEVLNFIGYASYPIYLIQNPLLLFYFPYFIRDETYHYFPRSPNRRYFRDTLPFWVRFGAIVLVIFIGWFVQKVIQDNLVANTFTSVMSWYRSRRSSSQREK